MWLHNCRDRSIGYVVIHERAGAYRFMLWVGAREEKNIVVACHSGFLLNVFNSVIEFSSQGAAATEADQMQSWFETGMGIPFVTSITLRIA